MKTFEFNTDYCLGYHCIGSGEYVHVFGEFTLYDEDIETLVNLVRENNGEDDIEKLDLKTRLPEVYETIYDAYVEAIDEAIYNHWVLEGYHNSYFEESEDAMDFFEEKGLFQFEPDLGKLREKLGLKKDEEIPEEYLANAKEEAFGEWKDEYSDSLSDDADLVEFIEACYDVDFDFGPNDYSCIKVPQEIVDMAKDK